MYPQTSDCIAITQMVSPNNSDCIAITQMVSQMVTTRQAGAGPTCSGERIWREKLALEKYGKAQGKKTCTCSAETIFSDNLLWWDNLKREKVGFGKYRNRENAITQHLYYWKHFPFVIYDLPQICNFRLLLLLASLALHFLSRRVFILGFVTIVSIVLSQLFKQTFP